MTTKQGSGAARDERAEILRRINNVVKFSVMSRGEIVPSDRDVAWLKRDLKTMLADTSNDFIRNKLATGQYDALKSLIAEAEQKP